MSESGELSAADQQFLREAAEYLENPRFLMQVANLIGKPAEGVLQLIPRSAQNKLTETTRSALQTALRWAVRTLPDQPGPPADARLPKWPAPPASIGRRVHTAAAATAGAVGGFFGFAGLLVEAPITTLIMLRSIAEIAAENGLDPNDPVTRLQCLSVLSLGGQKLGAMESAYLTSRLGLALAINEVAGFLARHSAGELTQALARGTAPVLVRLMNLIASRFHIVLSQKMAVQSVPVTGAALGALINAAFTDHFNQVARYHFGVMRMERLHGKDRVQTAYRRALEELRSLPNHSALDAR